MKAIILILFFLTCDYFAVGQANEITKINHLLDTETYYDIVLDYNISVALPDSIKQKFLATLQGAVPKWIADSILYVSQEDKNNLWDFCKSKCKGDSICAKEKYKTLLQDEYNYKYKKLYNYYKVNKTVILAAGSWSIYEAVPILKNAIENTKYDQLSVLMALAKLGDDSVKQVLLKKYTLSYVIQNTQFDTINDDVILYDLPTKPWLTTEGIEAAMYLKSKEMLLNILELIYIKGISGWCIGIDCYDYPYVSYLVNELSNYPYFREFPNHEKLYKICADYRSAIWNLCDKKRNKKERKELELLLSTAYRTTVKEQLREWVIENVNFE